MPQAASTLRAHALATSRSTLRVAENLDKVRPLSSERNAVMNPGDLDTESPVRVGKVINHERHAAGFDRRQQRRQVRSVRQQLDMQA